MEAMEQGKQALISGIEADAVSEEKKILETAEKQAAEKIRYAEKKVASLLDGARKKAEEQADAQLKRVLSATELEIKRQALHARQALVQDILDQVEKQLEARIDENAYDRILIDWIAEAATGIDTDEARVNASAKERPLLTGALLKEAEEKVKNEAGREIRLTLSEAPPLDTQGITLTAIDGRTAFNNQVKTRIRMNRNQIDKLITNALFAGNE